MPTTAPEEHGVQFPLVEGRRSSQSTTRAVLADAVRAVDPDAAREIDLAPDWHRSYARHLRTVEAVTARSGKAALTVAADGLDALRNRMVFVRDGVETSVAQALAAHRTPHFETVSVAGVGSHPKHLVVPYRKRELSGDDLLRQVDRWVRAGVIEPSCAEALGLVVNNPDWLDTSDLTVALVGAAAEMGPLDALCAWGADVIALDIPGRRLWERIVMTARNGCGRLSAPVATSASPAERAQVVPAAGADLLTQTPEIRTWLDGFDRPVVVGNYAYADGAAFVRVAVAADALVTDLLASRPGSGYAYLASPTDVFAVTDDIVAGARARAARATGSRLVRLASGGRLFTPNYRTTVTCDDGRVFGLADSVVLQQGPNYALAKRMQRWRAVAARESAMVSANVAPATRTRSVTKNRILAAAYAGAGRFGVEIFEPATSSRLMAALLVHDLRNPSAAANPRTELSHPAHLFTEDAAHGGLWRLPYEPRSVLGLAVVAGAARIRR